MNLKTLRDLLMATFAVLLCSCSATSLKSTWKSPDYHGGPVRKVAVLAMDQGSGYRPMFEGQVVAQLEQRGQAAFKTLDLLTVPEIKADKQAAAAKLRAAGADSVLIVRLVDSVDQSSLAPSTRSSTTVTTESGSTGWFEYFTSYSSGPGMEKSLTLNVFLETSLYDLQSEKKLWSGLTKTVVSEDMDRSAAVGPLVTTILDALRADGLVR
jgi:hypothetical protein